MLTRISYLLVLCRMIMCLARKQLRSWTKSPQAHICQSLLSLLTLLRYFCWTLSNNVQDLQQFCLLPGVSGTVSVSPESRSSNKRTVISSPLLDYPAYTLEACLAPISRHIRPCFLGKAFIHSMKVESTQLRYCYRIIVDSTFEYRTVSWKSMAPSQLSQMKSSSLSSSSSIWDIPTSEMNEDIVISQSVQESSCPHCSAVSLDCDPSMTNCSFCSGSQTVCNCLVLHSEQQTECFSRFVNTCHLPEKCVDRAKGRLSFQLDGRELEMASPFLDRALNNEVQQILMDIRKWSFENEVMTRRQTLLISVVPVREVVCSLCGFRFDFLVYDYDKKVVCQEFARISKWAMKFGLWTVWGAVIILLYYGHSCYSYQYFPVDVFVGKSKAKKKQGWNVAFPSYRKNQQK